MSGKILGKLKGILASANEPSRNGRKYTEKFWDKIFNSDMFNEGIKNKMFFGELWHPEDDYEQIHPGDRSAVVLENVEKQGLDYYGTFSILPTHAGKTLKDLIDVGCVFGVSSRGIADYDSSVFDNPDSYNLITFDIVAFPGIKSARLKLIDDKTLITESYTLKKNKEATAKESLKNISKSNKFLKAYIKETLIKKENYSKDCNEDLDSYKIVVYTDDSCNPFYNEKPVVIPYDDYELEKNSEYLVDDIYYNDDSDSYRIVGTFYKL